MKRNRREFVGADRGQNLRLNAGVAFEAAVDIRTEVMVSRDFIEQLEDDARSEAMELLDVTLAAKLLRGLCAKGGEAI